MEEASKSIWIYLQHELKPNSLTTTLVYESRESNKFDFLILVNSVNTSPKFKIVIHVKAWSIWLIRADHEKTF